MSERKTHEQFLIELEQVNPLVDVLGHYETAVKKINVRCKKCGNIWETKPCLLLSGRGCPLCGRKKVGDSLRKSHESFIAELSKKNDSMQDNTEYQIYIGCHDSQLRGELVSEDELRAMVVEFFKKKEMAFSMFSAKGGYIYNDSSFIYENSLCINIIGTHDLDIIKLAKSLSMFMNQECSLVVKDIIKTEYR